MTLHGNAKTCPHSRLLLVRRVLEQGWTVAEAAVAAGISERTACKWLSRYRSEGVVGLIAKPDPAEDAVAFSHGAAGPLVSIVFSRARA